MGGNLRSSFSKKKSIVVAGLIVSCLIGLGLSKYWPIYDLDRDAPLISDEVNRYLVMEFIPKYRVDECVVSFAVHLKDETSGYLDEVNLAFWRYITKHEPKIGTMIYQNYPGPDHFVYFADQCDRRDEIFVGMAENVEKHFGDKMAIERLPVEVPVQGFMRLWVDSPDYDPDFWPTLHRATRGEGEAFLALVDFVKPHDHIVRHLYLALAEFYLSDGPLKDKARQRKEAALKEMTPDFQEGADKIIESWKQNIQRYQTK